MSTSENEHLSGLNGRLRPRRSTTHSPNTGKAIRKLEPKTSLDRQKRTSNPSKVVSTKQDDLISKPDSTNSPQHLCPFCDRKFASKQTASQHARRVHLSPKQATLIDCLFCNHAEPDCNDIIRHMVDSHPNQYFACLDCHTRFAFTSELAEHKLNVCEKQKVPYRSKLRQKVSSGTKKTQKLLNVEDKDFRSDGKAFPEVHRFNGVVISCELKPSQVTDEADIEDNITTNLILPPCKNLGPNAAIEKNAVILLDDIQWNKRMPTNFSFHNTDADQILSRLGVVHRSPRTGESTKKDWLKCAEEATQRFEKCFDTNFYSKVASNVHENMSKFLDGSFNFNPDPDSIIKTRKSKNSVAINAAEGFPILLACEQYSRGVFDGYMPRALAPKHKWKWENDKTPLNPDDIKQDTHVHNCIITLVSSLDIWTQLCMRRKFEDKFGIAPLEKRTAKQNTISRELKEILESRVLPSSSQQVVKFINKPMTSRDCLDFPTSLGLKPSGPTYDVQPAVLSGEWVRPRCFVCCACGTQTRDSRGLTSHISTQHPNAQVQYYEIVGELLLNADILKHLYVPPSQMCNRTRPLRGFRECTKCKKSISLEDLHQHMLDCAGDTPAVRRKCRYRPFGVRRRRTRLPDNTIRKKIRKDIRTRQSRQKSHIRPSPKIRSEVGDAETIRKMLADLPAKRHRVMVNPMNPILRPRRKLDKQRNKLIMKRRASELLKNRKHRNLKGNSLSRIRSNSEENEDSDSKNPHKSDDENKPLKPKVKTMKITRSRQSEALKRKVALNRAKRRAQIKEKKAAEENLEQNIVITSNSSGIMEQLSIDNSSQRIDVCTGPYNTREHSSRGRSNNRDDQRPGPSSQDSNTHNSYNPSQNVPLKHSIARLTAYTDMHDQNMQFHHLYLIPPECNEVTQHVPTGQQRLFENEAVVTKLDKPPLHFNPSGPVEPFICQKSKQCNTSNNKRKGLNDCIAMLKNKAGQCAESSDAVSCNNEDRLTCEKVTTNQNSPNLDLHMNMNYDTNTRPAEIFSRHQFMPERFVEYHPDRPDLIAQNFADLPFHYLPSQQIAFDLAQPDSRIDPRFVKPSRQKQNDGKQTTRRRSTRSEKDHLKRQDCMLRSSSVHYPVNVSTPSKVTATHSRRASTQNVEVSTNTVVSKRRSSGSYNQTRKTVYDYHTESMISRQRLMEYHPHRILPETHAVELNHSEAYVEAQKNLHRQMIACAENYVTKKQLAVGIDTNYTNKKSNTSPKCVYTSSIKSISPGSDYLKVKQVDEDTDIHLIDNHTNNIHSLESNYSKNKVSNTKKGTSFNKKASDSNTDIATNNPYAASSLEADLISKGCSYLDNAYVNKKVTAVSIENDSTNIACNESLVNNAYLAGTTETNLINRTQALPLTESNFVKTTAVVAQGSNETIYADKKRTTKSTENNLSPEPLPIIPGEINYITKKRAATSESCYIRKKQLATSECGFISHKQSPFLDIPFTNKKQSASSDIKKQAAAALECNLNEKLAFTPEYDNSDKKLVSSPEADLINNVRPIPLNESNNLDNKPSDLLEEIYTESAFNNLPPAIIPSTYPTMSVSFESGSNEMEAPLDLSKNTSNENTEISEIDDEIYLSENFDNYETLDLSHKNTDDVVDLSLKVSSPTPTLDMSSKLQRISDIDGVTDLSTKIRDDDTPTDLTVKRKINNNAYEYDSRNASYKDISGYIQDLRKTHTEKHNTLTLNRNDNIPTDLSGRNRDFSLDMVAPNSPNIEIHIENVLQHVDNQKAAELSANFNDCFEPKNVDAKNTEYDSNVHEQTYNINNQISNGIAATVQAPTITPEIKQSVAGTVINTALNVVTTAVINSGIDNKAIPRIPSPIPLLNAVNTVVVNTSKLESTTPVYTLANACISMTKTEPSRGSLLSDVIIQNTTTSSADSVYTLTHTSIDPLNHEKMHNKFSPDALSTTENCTYNCKNTTDSNNDGENILCETGMPITKSCSVDELDTERKAEVSDLDPETAKKIAMLPKELVEILGTMPEDHRNQLLNVLPQYVSSTPALLSQNESSSIPAANTNTSIANNKALSPPKISDFDVKPALLYSPVSSSQYLCPTPLTQPVTALAPCGNQVNEIMLIPVNAAIDKNYVAFPRLNEVDGNTVIDLTDDEPIIGDVKKNVVEPTGSEVIPVNKSSDVATNSKLNKQKVNDQTASLRAVRIKAPSERKKSSSMDNNNTGPKDCGQEHQLKSNVTYEKNLDSNLDKKSDLDKTLAIQQAEISSTQHNTMIAGHCKYPQAISPSSTEYSSDESNKHVAQSSLKPVTETVQKNIEDNNYKNVIPKTGIVTSSISTNVLNLPVGDNSLNSINANTEALTKSCEVDNNDSLLLLKSKESDSSNYEVTDLNTAEKCDIDDSNRSTQDLNYEEDSEDDMSLAAIIKQKMLDQVNNSEVNLQGDKTNQQSNKKKKEKKRKKANKSTARDDVLEDISLNDSKDIPTPKCAVITQENEVDDLHSQITTQVSVTPEDNEVNKNAKKRSRRCRRPVVSPIDINIQSDKVHTIQSDKEINKENNAISKINNNKSNSDYFMTEDVKGAKKESPPRSHEAVYGYDVQNEKVKLKSKLIVNKEFSSDKDVIVRIRKLSDDISNPVSISNEEQRNLKETVIPLQFSKATSPESGNKDKKDNSVTVTSESPKLDPNVLIASTAPDECDERSHIETQESCDGNDNSNSVNKNDTNLTQELDIIGQDVDVDIPQQILADYDITENNVNPLRRSRRGKSLFLKSIPSDKDLFESTPDQKTPLTKKQLIFSKLRLDEDTPEPTAHSTPESQKVVERESSHLFAERTIDVTKNPCKTFEEKAKSTKRKIKTQIFKKSKKRKSFEGQNQTNEDLNKTNFENIRDSSETTHLLKSDIENRQIEPSNELKVTFVEKSYETITDDTHDPTVSTEKRKIYSQVSLDDNSKPKKCKMTEATGQANVKLTDIHLINNVTEDTAASITTETKTACYNLVPARRGRSKSVVVKSSGTELYDPYDIDFEDMAEQHEAYKGKQCTGKDNRNKMLKSDYKENNKLETIDYKSNRIFDTQQKEKDISSHDDGNIDSDDSTKSDVPLNCYLNKKKKKGKGVKTVLKRKKPKVQQKSTTINENKNFHSSSIDETAVLTQTEAEQDLRSEQFLENFGFFSEKKPRKSNLLASKKISETINITNESDDMYFGFKKRPSKKIRRTENKKSSKRELSKIQPQPSTSRKIAGKRGRKKRAFTKFLVMPRHCEICKKQFRRSDNYLRHSVSSKLHLSKLSETEFKTIPVKDIPNYLIAYRIYFKRYIRLLDKLAILKKRNAKAAAKIPLPTHREIIFDVKEAMKELMETESAKEGCKDKVLILNFCKILQCANKDRIGSALVNFKNAIDEEEAKQRECDDDDVDSITAKNILESEEVLKLENELISGLKEAALAKRDSKLIQETANDLASLQLSISQRAMPTLSIPQETIPEMTMHHVPMPQVIMPQMIMPQVVMPHVIMPQVIMPDMIMPHMSPGVQINRELQEDPMAHIEPPSDDIARSHDVPQDIREETEFNEFRKEKSNLQISSPINANCNYDNIKDFNVPAKAKATKVKKHMYPDIIEDIDMFEDKFDKIKRKSRSQAVAAKQPQPVIEQTTSYKGRKKIDKKKGKKSCKKALYQNTQVPTKGALKGFDGIKVSIPTSDINLSCIVPVYESSPKKKKKSGCKRKWDKNDSESNGKYDGDHRFKDISSKKVDVYEFMDNEDAELFEFRTSTLMERFKNINYNKDMPSTSKVNHIEDDNSSDSASDGDDFVYMSDDYVCSDEETESSLISCEMINAKIGNDNKKNAPQKRKDVIEKNAVMGKIFKLNAVRTEKKPLVIKESAKPKANLDQLFDSLLEEEPNSSVLNSGSLSPKAVHDTKVKYSQSSKYERSSDPCYENLSDETFVSPQEPHFSSSRNSDSYSSAIVSKRRNSSPLKQHIFRKHNTTSKNNDLPELNFGASTSKKNDVKVIDYRPSSSKKYDSVLPNDYKDLSPKSIAPISSKKHEEKLKYHETKNKKRNNSLSSIHEVGAFMPYSEDSKSPTSKLDEGISTSYDYNIELCDESLLDDTGVARQRARRKCTVGKQNVLSETWSSEESELDGGPPRPKSVESVISCLGRKKKGKKKDGHQLGGKRGYSRQVGYKKQNIESRVMESRAASCVASASGIEYPVSEQSIEESTSCTSADVTQEVIAGTSASDKSASAAMPAPPTSHAHAIAGPSGLKARRSVANYWSSEGGDDQEHLQQHGWIVGDSHKKLVTMLAHAKGRKRNDDKRHLVE